MLTPARSLTLSAESGKALPKIPAFRDLYNWGVTPRFGEVTMIVGRSGAGKSTLALYWTAQMAKEHDVHTLYFSADMSPFVTSARLASMFTGLKTEEIERMMLAGGEARKVVLDSIKDLPMSLAYGALDWRMIDEELEAYVELWDRYPDVIVIDNLMDFEGAESDYAAQMQVMSNVAELSRATSAAVIVLHHATDKSQDARDNPGEPAPRSDIKGGMSEKPRLILSVAYDQRRRQFNIACVKQTSGPSDQSARRFVTLHCDPETSSFDVWG